MSERIKFTVYRHTWIRGDGSGVLLNDHGCRCCLGHLARDLGIPDDKLRGFGTPAYSGAEGFPASLVTDAACHSNTEACINIVQINDAPTSDEDVREARLSAAFRAIGIDVEFRDSAEVTEP